VREELKILVSNRLIGCCCAWSLCGDKDLVFLADTLVRFWFFFLVLYLALILRSKGNLYEKQVAKEKNTYQMTVYM